jgi:exosortase
MTVETAALAVLLVVLFWHVIVQLESKWQRSEDWSHGFIIPLFSLYFLYIRRDRLPWGLKGRAGLSGMIGALVLVVAYALYLRCTVARVDYPKDVALVMSLLGVMLMVCGWPVTRWSWFALLFLMFAMPLPESLYQQLTSPLQKIAAWVAAGVLAIVPNMLTEASGTVVEYSFRGRIGTLDIAQACSGMRLLMAMTALGIAIAFVSDRPLWQRLAMILACLPIALLCNIIRVTTTGFFVVFGRDDLARGTTHQLLGLMMLAVAFALYMSMSYVLSHLVVDGEPAEDAEGGRAI